MSSNTITKSPDNKAQGSAKFSENYISFKKEIINQMMEFLGTGIKNLACLTTSDLSVVYFFLETENV